MITSISDLIAFLRGFHRHWLDDPSLDPALIPSDLPEGLAAIYRELGALVEVYGARDNCLAPFHAQDSLLPVGRLTRIGGMLEFVHENSGNWAARCPIGLADPPVYTNEPGLWDGERRGFVKVCDSLNHFLTTFCLQEALASCKSVVAVRADLPPSEALTIAVDPLWLNGRYASGEPDRHFYTSSDRDVLVMDWAGLWIGSTTRGAADLVRPGVNTLKIN